MTVPTISNIGDVFIIDWEQEKIKLKVDRLIERSEGVTGEILVTQNDGHLYHARVNLLSPHSKKVMANELTQRINTLDWQTMLEQAFTKTLKLYRRGEPVINIGNLPRRTSPRFRLKPLVLEGQMTALYAHGGSGKSLVALLIAILVQSGVEFLGFTPVKGNVLILDWETSEETVDERTKAILTGLGLDNWETPYYRRCYHLLTHDIAEIQKEIIEKQVELIIIDSAGMAAGFDRDYHSVAVEMLRALRSLNISVLIIDHKPKIGDTMFGSVYKFNECRAGFEIKSTQEEGSNCMELGIFHAKFNDTPKMKPIGLHIEFQGDEDYTEVITFTRKDVSDIPSLMESLSQKQRIINVLKSEAKTQREIAEETGFSEGNIRAVCNRFKNTFVRTENGWGLLLKDDL